VGHALVDLHTLLENSGKQMELKLTPALHTKKHKKEKIKGTLTVKVTFPSQLFEDLETLKQLQEMSKMNASDLENIWKIFNEFSGKKDVLKDKRDIINLAKKANVPQKLNNLLVDFSMLPTELLKNIERVDMMSDDDLYAYVMQLFDTNKDGDLALKEFVMGMVMLSKTSDAEKAELRFNLYDKSGTGVLSEEELKLMQRDYARVGKGFFIGFLGFALKKVLGNTFTASQIDELIRDLANTLFTDEFNQKGFELMKQNIDLNHDGTISKEEYIRFCCDEEIQAKYREEVSKAIQPVLDRFTREGSRLIQQWVLTHFLH
jgi:Ca2+-binding EF-hand superfamily protein